MLTLSATSELEQRLEEEAAKHGLQASEYALRLLEGFLRPNAASAEIELIRADAIDRLSGITSDSAFSSAVFRSERDHDLAREEERHRHHFGRG